MGRTVADEPTPEVRFEGEEAGSGYASPTLDLIATGFLIFVSVLVMAASLALPVPGDIQTAPGLLPFLTAATLLIMALGLGASALARRRAGARSGTFGDRDLPTDIRTLVLAGTVAAYIAALQVLAFRSDIVFLGVRYSMSAFEPATTITLAVIIHMNWRGPIWITCLISILWAFTLSSVFQFIFKIPLPGTF